MSVKISKFKTYTGDEGTGIGANSVDTTTGQCFVTKSGSIVSKATAGSEISGVALTSKVYASDNQTVDARPLNFIPTKVDMEYEVTITGGTITIADETKYYDLTDSVTVDGSTESTTTGQLRMTKFISSTASVFEIANL